MNAFLLVAGGLTIALCAAHSYLGERLLLRPLFSGELPKLIGSRTFARRTLRFAWHLTSVLGAGVGLWIAALAFVTPNSQTLSSLRFFAGVFVACSITALIGARGKHFSWYVFLIIAVATWLGASQ